MDSFIADYSLIQGAKPNDNCKPTQNAELYLLCFLILCGNLLLTSRHKMQVITALNCE